ncbi:EF-hand domain-containing family member B [Carcharodon carcharias]|uniref:EF-hand domain-containing family member B n=1 Tax=Carcharodon carcharias TaxID=13397 RepID=UPI001B7EEB43|nr:EF-hand domain-containing family member B [Carcharodon carcharias]
MSGVVQPLKPVYTGKFTDKDPLLDTAGKLVPTTGSAGECLTEIQPRFDQSPSTGRRWSVQVAAEVPETCTDQLPAIDGAQDFSVSSEWVSGATKEQTQGTKTVTPPVVKKFLSSSSLKPGKATIFHGKAADPDIASQLQHGLPSKVSTSAASLLNPPMKTRVQQIFLDKITATYPSNQRAPLGKSHDQAPGLPKGMDIYNTTFGKRGVKDISAGELLNPPKTQHQVYEESKKGHPLYIVTHNDYNVGEQRDRKYDWSRHSRYSTFGLETPYFNDGRLTAKSLRWLTEEQQRNSAKIVSKKVEDFREKTNHQIGKVHDPNADTRKIPPDHTFGVLLHPDKYGVGDLIYYRNPTKFLRGKDRDQGTFTILRQHLKKINFHNFKSLLEAFRHYDKNGDGKIDREELRDVCIQFNLKLDPKLIDQLIEYCDIEGDGTINFLEFANFLNWKDKMPLGKMEQMIIAKGTKCFTSPTDDGSGLVAPEDIVPLDIGSSAKTLRTIIKKEDRSNGHYWKTSSLINGVVGSYSPADYRTCGIPTIRTDLPAPRFRRISDTINYGDEATASALLNPSIFAQRNVYEKDMFIGRSKEEIKKIFCKVGVDMSKETFEEVWKQAAMMHPKGEVSVETFRDVLDEIQTAQTLTC